MNGDNKGLTSDLNVLNKFSVDQHHMSVSSMNGVRMSLLLPPKGGKYVIMTSYSMNFSVLKHNITNMITASRNGLI